MSGERGARVILVLIGALVVVLVVWLIGSCGSDDDSASSTVAPEIVDADALKERAEDQESPIYWAGEQEGTEIELSVPEEGRTYVRYLTEGTEVGAPTPDYLTVGTYAFAQPIPALEELATKPGGVQRSAADGGIVYFNRDVPNSVYLAFPGQEVEIEIYDPDPARAKELATTGAIVPVE